MTIVVHVSLDPLTSEAALWPRPETFEISELRDSQGRFGNNWWDSSFLSAEKRSHTVLSLDLVYHAFILVSLLSLFFPGIAARFEIHFSVPVLFVTLHSKAGESNAHVNEPVGSPERLASSVSMGAAKPPQYVCPMEKPAAREVLI